MRGNFHETYLRGRFKFQGLKKVQPYFRTYLVVLLSLFPTLIFSRGDQGYLFYRTHGGNKEFSHLPTGLSLPTLYFSVSINLHNILSQVCPVRSVHILRWQLDRAKGGNKCLKLKYPIPQNSTA